MLAPQKPTSSVEFDQVFQRIQSIVDDEGQRKELLENNGDVAQEWLDLFQLLVEYPNVPKTLRSWIFKLMIRLSRKSNLHPQCLTIRDVEKLGKHPVGGGAFGDVWKGRVGQQLVCLKVIRAFEDSDVKKTVKDYMQEAIIWRQMDHPNLLPFLGIYYLDIEQQQLCLVSPWMERGNLVQYLKKTPPELVDHESLAHDVACGLSHLHEANIVHGDLKGDNVLIAPDLRACIGDFGLSRVSTTHPSLTETSRSKGTTRWLSPELLKPGPNCVPSKQTDVYAYACVCYEIFTGKIPFYELPNEATVLFAVLLDKKRPSFPDDCAKLRDSMWGMMIACWDESSSSRPTMADVVVRIQGMNTDIQLKSVPKSGWEDPAFTQIWSDVRYPPVIQHPQHGDPSPTTDSQERDRTPRTKSVGVGSQSSASGGNSVDVVTTNLEGAGSIGNTLTSGGSSTGTDAQGPVPQIELDPSFADPSAPGQSQGQKHGLLSGFSFGKKYFKIGGLGGIFGGDQSHPHIRPEEIKRNKKEVERLQREAEKQRRAVAERKMREQARLVMHKRNMMVQKAGTKDIPEAERGAVDFIDTAPNNKGTQVATELVRRGRSYSDPGASRLIVNAASGRFASPGNGSPGGTTDWRIGERMTKTRRRDHDEGSVSPSDVHPRRMSRLSFSTIDNDPGPSRIKNRPRLFGFRKMTSASSLRSSFNGFAPPSRSSNLFSLDGHLAGDFRTQASLKTVTPPPPLLEGVSTPPMQTLSLSPISPASR